MNDKLEFSEFIGVSIDQNKQEPRKNLNYRVSVNSESSLFNPTGSLLSLSSSIHEELMESSKKTSVDLNNGVINDYKGERAVKIESENLSGSWRAYSVYIRLGSSWYIGPLLIIVFIISQTLFSGYVY